MKKYIVVRRSYVDDLEIEINKYLLKGAQLVGGVSISQAIEDYKDDGIQHTEYAQALLVDIED
jgi:hypothetical protein